MIAPDAAWFALVDFLDAKLGPPPFGKNQFTRDQDLYHDLDLNADAACALLHEWAQAFSVDLSAFNARDYFPMQGTSNGVFFATLLRAIVSRSAREKLGGTQITLGLMEQAMIDGKWPAFNGI